MRSATVFGLLPPATMSTSLSLDTAVSLKAVRDLTVTVYVLAAAYLICSVAIIQFTGSGEMYK